MASSSNSGGSRSRRGIQKVSQIQSQSSQSRIDSIEYCVRILNYLIGSLKLRDIPPIVTVENITMEVLIRIHCKLMGIDFTTEFIPSQNPKDDAERIILSLKDKYGTDKFDALDADRIVQKHPVHLRFLIENYHLIHDHQYKRSLGVSSVLSASGHHLGVTQPTEDELKGGDSFYIFPSTTSLSPPQTSAETLSKAEEPTSSQEEGEATSFLDPEFGDFETVDDFVFNVYNSSTPNETLNDTTLENSSFSEKQALPNIADKIRSKRPLSSSPVDNTDWNQSSLITAPNESSIRGSPSEKVQQISQNKIKRPLSSSPVDNKKLNQSSLITAPNASSIRGSPSEKVQQISQNKIKRPLSSSPVDNKKLNQSSFITAPNESSIRGSPSEKVQQISQNKIKRPLSSSPVDNKKLNQSSLITAPNASSIRGSPSEKVQQTQNKIKRPLSSSPVDNKKLNQSSLITAPNTSSIRGSPSEKVQHKHISQNKIKRPLSSSPVDNKKLNQSSLITAPNASSIRGSPSEKVQQISQNKIKRPLSSSPVDNKKLNQSSLITAPNASSVRGSPTKKVQRTIESRKSHSNTGNGSNLSRSLTKQVSSTAGLRRRQLESDFSKESTKGKTKTAEDLSNSMKSINSKKADKQSSELLKGRTTNTLSLTDTGSVFSNEENKELPLTELNSAEVLHEVRDMHQNIRKQLTESWDAIDSEINKLKEKTSCPELKDECPPQPIPNIRWMMPVDLRFPYYPGGIIRSKCKQFKRAQVKKPQPSSKPSQASQVGFAYSNSSTTVEKGSGTVFLDETDTE